MQNDHNAQQGGRPSYELDDATLQRGQAMRDSMWKGGGGFEIALAPVILAVVGWFLDGYLGTTPILTVILAIAGLAGAVANQYYRYVASMDLATAERMARHHARSATSPNAPVSQKAFGPVPVADAPTGHVDVHGHVA